MTRIKITNPDLLQQTRSFLATTPRRWLDLAQSLSPDVLNAQPKAGEWSAVECLQHIIDVEKVFQFRLQAFLDQKPELAAFFPEKDGSKTEGPLDAVELADEFARLRQETLKMLLLIISTSDLNRRSRHLELGMVTLAQMLHEWVAHDLNHTMQAERALIQPFIAGCGPWQKYFSEIIIEE